MARRCDVSEKHLQLVRLLRRPPSKKKRLCVPLYMAPQASMERRLDTVRRTNVMVCLGTVVLLDQFFGMCMYDDW